MARTSRSRSPPTRNTTLAIRIREPLAPKDIIAPVAGDSVPTRANRRPYPGCSSDLPHRHSTAESSVAPLVEEHQKTSEAIRKHWTENQKCRIAENEAVLRQLADIEPKVANLSIGTHFPRGNDLTVQEQIAIIHGGATPAQYEAPHKTLLERQREYIINHTNPISPEYPPSLDVPQTKVKRRIANRSGAPTTIRPNAKTQRPEAVPSPDPSKMSPA